VLRCGPALATAVLMLGSASSVAAQRVDSGAARRLDTLRTTTSSLNGVNTSDAASSGHVTPQVIDDRPLLRPGAVMEYIPGMIVTQHSGGGKANQYFLRGFNLDHGTDFETTLGGMPVNLSSHAHGQGYTDLNFVIPELVGRIDYFKGPYFAAQGDFATAGSASIRYADSPGHATADLPAGSHDYGRAVVFGSRELGRGRVVFGVEASHVNGPWINPDNYRKLNAVIRYVRPVDAGRWSITAMAYDGRWHATDQIPERAVAAGAISPLGSIDTSDGGNSHRYSLSADYQKVIGSGVLQTAAYGVRYYLDLYSNFTYFLDDPVHGDQIDQRDDRTIAGWSGSWIAPARLFGHDMTNTVGWNLRSDHVSPSGLYHTEDRQRLSTTLEDTVRETRAALYVENRAEWTPWLRTIAGLRSERTSFSVGSNIVENSGGGAAAIALPKLSVILGPWRRSELFLNAGEGYHSNDVRGATERIDPSTRNATDPVTPLVRAVGGELGVRTERVLRLQSSLSLWYLHIASELVFNGDAGTTTPGRPSRRLGVEWSNHYAASRWLLFDLDLATTSARFTDPAPTGNHIPEALQSTAAAGITVRAVGPWTAAVFLRYLGPRSLVESDSVRSTSTTLLNTQTTYDVSRKIRIRVDVFNVLNQKSDDIAYYYASRLRGEPARGVADLHFHPVESRAIRVGVMALF
jgi:hypothetical protein